jgi:hypothetical protein
LRFICKEESLFVPVAWNLIHSKLPKAEWRQLVDMDLLDDPLPYDRYAGRSREYKVADWVLCEFIKRGSNPELNLFTGRRSVKMMKSVYYDAYRHAEPELIRRSIKQITNCPFDLRAVEQHVQRLEDSYRKMEGTRDYNKSYRSFLNDKACLQAILQQQPESTGGGLHSYQPAYRVSTTGRIHQLGGALQSCTGEMKRAAYEGLQMKFDLHNYDLSASQANGLIQFFEEAGTDTGWLKQYRDTPQNKEVYALRAGLSVGVWKTCLLALIMGAHLPRDTKSKKNSILKELAKVAGGDSAKLRELLNGFKDVISPLPQQIESWHKWLLESYLPRHKKHGRGGSFILNHTKKRFSLPKSLTLGWWNCEGKRRVSAFLLQGLEAATIHHLTTLGEIYGFQPIANEHDGLVTIGEIPEEAIIEAASLSGFRYASLVEKSFG